MINESSNKAVNSQPPALNEGSASKTENLSSVISYKQANINVKSQRFGIVMTPFSRQNE